MPVLNVTIDPNQGALLPVLIGGQQRLALIDTGAEHSAIDLQLAHELGLKEVGQTELITPTEPEGKPAAVYQASISIEAPGMISEMDARLNGAELSKQGFTVILGRDVLGRLLVVWDGPAKSLRLCV